MLAQARRLIALVVGPCIVHGFAQRAEFMCWRLPALLLLLGARACARTSLWSPCCQQKKCQSGGGVFLHRYAKHMRTVYTYIQAVPRCPLAHIQLRTYHMHMFCYIRRYTYTYTPACTHAFPHAFICMSSRACVHACMDIHTNIHPSIHMCMQSCSCIQTPRW